MSSMRLADVLNPSSTLALRVSVLATLIWAGHAKAEDLVTPAIEGVVAAGTKIELIQDGFNGTEGPLPLPDGSLIFTETPAQRITRIAANDMHIEVAHGAARQEVMVPFGEIQEIQLKHKDT